MSLDAGDIAVHDHAERAAGDVLRGVPARLFDAFGFGHVLAVGRGRDGVAAVGLVQRVGFDPRALHHALRDSSACHAISSNRAIAACSSAYPGS